MIGKQNQLIDNEDNQSRIKLIANKRKYLEERFDQIQTEIKSCFEEITEVLRSRERQLLRQAEAIHRQQLSLVETSLDFLPSSIVALNGKSELNEQIRRFGNIEIQGSNGITVKDVEPYKVADYQDANKDHVSLDKSITCQKIRDLHLSLPRCKDFLSDYKTLHISNLPPAFLIENRFRDSQDVKNDAFVHFEDTLSLSGCSPLLIIKRKLGLTHVSLDGLHAFNRAYPRSVRSFEISSNLGRLDALEIETTESDLQQFDKNATNQNDSETNKCSKQPEKNYEHPMQVQQWLRQILAETEIEPAIHEIGQFSEISNAKLYNEL